MRCYDHSTNVLLVSSLVIRDPFPDETSTRTGAGLSPNSKVEDSRLVTYGTHASQIRPIGSIWSILQVPMTSLNILPWFLATIFDDLSSAVTRGETQEKQEVDSGVCSYLW